MSPADSHPDASLDAQLRNVPVPAGLDERLRAAVWDDATLDDGLRAVPVPMQLAEQLRQIPVETDEALDEVLRAVEIPLGLEGRLGRVYRRQVSWRAAGRWAVAASLCLALGVLYTALIAARLATLYTLPEPLPRLVSQQRAPVSLEVVLLARDDEALDALSESPWAAIEAAALPVDPVREPAVLSLPDPTWRPPDAARQPSPTSPDPGRWWAAGHFGPSVPDPFLDAAWFRWGPVFGVHRAFDELPELDKVVGLRPRGFDPPMVPGFDWATYRLTGVFPMASPASAGLQTSVVPLDVRTASYELLQRYLRDGMLPPASAVRTEEILAAIDYQFPRPTGTALALHLAGGPSIFGHREGLRLFQIGVQARAVAPIARPAMHLTLLVDQSASMRWGGRLDQIRAAVVRLFARLSPADRVSLIAFNEQAHVLGEVLGPGDSSRVEELLANVRAEGSTNLGEGLRAAYVVAERTRPADEGLTRVVVFTDGLGELDAASARRLTQRLQEAAQMGIGLEAIDLAQESTSSAQLAMLAGAGGGTVRRASGVDEIGWALATILTGQSQLVASETRLEIRWNPAAVAAYRLLGHEANPAADLMPAHPEAEFRAEQSATGLYELQLRPQGADEVAVVTLTWRDPASGKPQQLTQTMRRGQFANTLIEAPLSLQAVTIVAEAAEVLRESPLARYPNGTTSSLPLVLLAASRLDSGLRQNASFVEFVATLEAAAQAHPYRRGARAGRN